MAPSVARLRITESVRLILRTSTLAIAKRLKFESLETRVRDVALALFQNRFDAVGVKLSSKANLIQR